MLQDEVMMLQPYILQPHSRVMLQDHIVQLVLGTPELEALRRTQLPDPDRRHLARTLAH